MTIEPYRAIGVSSICAKLRQVFSRTECDSAARQTGFVERVRAFDVTTFIEALVGAVGSGEAASLASIHRRYNMQAQEPLDYRAFHHHLSKESFTECIKCLVIRALDVLVMKTFEPKEATAAERFSNIVFHDGSSFRLRDALSTTYPGRFTSISPAAVEVHVTASALTRGIESYSITPDSTAEKHERPSADTLTGALLLADRGYEDTAYFRDIDAHGGWYIVRGKSNGKPRILEARDAKGKRLRHLEGKKLLRENLPRHHVDLIVEFNSSTTLPYRERMVLLYRQGKRRKKEYQRLHTNLPKSRFPLSMIETFYRFRWQIEILFKELKSHTSLHKFLTTKTSIVEGMIHASMLALILKRFLLNAAELRAQKPLSVLKNARVAHCFLHQLLMTLMRGTLRAQHSLISFVMEFIQNNTTRSRVSRDLKTGSLKIKLRQAKSA